MIAKITGPDLAALAVAANAEIIRASEDDLDEIADLIQSDAKNNCPVATGALQDDIKVYASPGKRQIGNMNVPYSIFVHNGTWKMKARPYLFNASEANKNKWVSMILAHSGV
ncbi:MAG TPA: HK97-gp10 family putative phage morphogenesis protein [Patescibacteria group bacterium]